MSLVVFSTVLLGLLGMSLVVFSTVLLGLLAFLGMLLLVSSSVLLGMLLLVSFSGFLGGLLSFLGNSLGDGVDLLGHLGLLYALDGSLSVNLLVVFADDPLGSLDDTSLVNDDLL